MKKLLSVLIVLSLVVPLAAQKKPKDTKTPPPAAAAGMGAAAPALPTDDSRGAIRAELKSIRGMLQTKVAAAADTPTRNHAQDLIDQIGIILDPRGGAR